MATLEDVKNFKRYKLLYSKALEKKITKEEIVGMDGLENLLKLDINRERIIA